MGLSFAAIALLMFAAFGILPRTAQAPFVGVALDRGQFGSPGLPGFPYVYIPGETIRIRIDAGSGEVYDALVLVIASGAVLQNFNDIVMPPTGGLALDYVVPAALPDGYAYGVEVGDSFWIESGRATTLFASQDFAVQAYEFNVEVDRWGYVGGDELRVSWSATNLENRAVAAPGSGHISVEDTSGVALISPNPFPFFAPMGTVTFRVPDLANPAFDGRVVGWFNDTGAIPVRVQQDSASFEIDALGAAVGVERTYPPVSAVRALVRAFATDDPAALGAWGWPEPGILVSVEVWEVSGASPTLRPEYSASGLVTDASGEVTHVFRLRPGIADGTAFEVRANATHPNGIWRWSAKGYFEVRTSASFFVSLQLENPTFLSGDTLRVTANASGGGPIVTWTFEARDARIQPCVYWAPFGPLLSLQSGQSSTFSYAIPLDFEGNLCLRASADDDLGNHKTTALYLYVALGALFVNADRAEFRTGDTIMVTWSFLSNRLTNPSYFYEIRDWSWALVASGSASSSLAFLVPQNPSGSYFIEITASEDGRTVTGWVGVVRAGGYVLSVDLDRMAYAPGTTIQFQYQLIAETPGAPLPAAFRFTYGLVDDTMMTYVTTRAAGTLTYFLPASAGEGIRQFEVREFTTSEAITQSLTIDGTPPTAEAPTVIPARAGEPILVTATVRDEVGLSSVSLHWSLAGQSGEVPMSGSTDSFLAALPPPDAAGDLTVYVTAQDLAGNTVRSADAHASVAPARGGVVQDSGPVLVSAAAGGLFGAMVVVGAAALLRRKSSRPPLQPPAP